MEKIVLRLLSIRVMTATQPFSFEKTFSKWTKFGINWYWITPFEIYENSTLWTAYATDLGFIGVKLTPFNGKEGVEVSLFSNAQLTTNQVARFFDLLDRFIDLSKDLSPFYEMAAKYEALKLAVNDLFGMRVLTSPDFFGSTILAITLQRTSYGRSEKMLKSIYERYGMPVSFDGKQIITTPYPAKIAEVDLDKIKDECKLGYRAKYLKQIAQQFSSGFFGVEQIMKMSYEEAKTALCKLKGIGEYSADVIVPHPAFPVDSWSIDTIAKLFNIPDIQLENKYRMVKEFAVREFGDWQRYVYEYMVNDFDNLTKQFPE